MLIRRNSIPVRIFSIFFCVLLCSLCSVLLSLSFSFFFSFFFLTVAFLRSLHISRPPANESLRFQIATSWAYNQNILTSSSVAVLLPGTVPPNLQLLILFFFLPLSLSLTRSLPSFFCYVLTYNQWGNYGTCGYSMATTLTWSTILVHSI